MSISWIKYKKDNNSFKLVKSIGMNVIELSDLEDTDKKIEELVNNNCNTIIISDEVASCSESIIKKYAKTDEVNIIITPNKN